MPDAGRKRAGWPLHLLGRPASGIGHPYSRRSDHLIPATLTTLRSNFSFAGRPGGAGQVGTALGTLGSHRRHELLGDVEVGIHVLDIVVLFPLLPPAPPLLPRGPPPPLPGPW